MNFEEKSLEFKRGFKTPKPSGLGALFFYFKKKTGIVLKNVIFLRYLFKPPYYLFPNLFLVQIFYLHHYLWFIHRI